MSKECPNNLNSIIREALVPKGFRPADPAGIEAMLDTIGGDKFSDDKIERMLRKIRGEEPIGLIPAHDEDEGVAALSNEERTLVTLYRAKGLEIPPEVQAKLDAMRRRAKGQDGANDGQ